MAIVPRVSRERHLRAFTQTRERERELGCIASFVRCEKSVTNPRFVDVRARQAALKMIPHNAARAYALSDCVDWWRARKARLACTTKTPAWRASLGRVRDGFDRVALCVDRWRVFLAAKARAADEERLALEDAQQATRRRSRANENDDTPMSSRMAEDTCDEAPDEDGAVAEDEHSSATEEEALGVPASLLLLFLNLTLCVCVCKGASTYIFPRFVFTRATFVFTRQSAGWCAAALSLSVGQLPAKARRLNRLRILRLEQERGS